jgi:hypothetical protein
MSESLAARPLLMVLLGPPAVGKMTVGQELARRTGFRLIHAHQFFDLVTDYFPFETPACHRLVQAWRTAFCSEAVAAGMDLITTDAWDFNLPRARTVPPPYVQAYLAHGHVCCVELVAPLEVLLARNATANRRRHKKTAWSTGDHLRRFIPAHRFDSDGTFPFALPHLRLETASLSVAATTQRIIAHFALPG